MKWIILAVITVTVPVASFAETTEQEATHVCSEFIRIKKECYYKAAKGILPINGLKGIKSKYPKELAEMSCREGFDAFGRAGKLKPDLVNQAMQSSYTQCYDGFIAKSNCSDLMSAMRNAKTEMESYYADNQRYPEVIPNLGSYNVNGIMLSSTGSGQVYRITGKHSKCSTDYGTSSEINEIKSAYDVPEVKQPIGTPAGEPILPTGRF